jgi:hypothetical protein
MNSVRVNRSRTGKCLEENCYKMQRAALNVDRVADEEDSWFLCIIS